MSKEEEKEPEEFTSVRYQPGSDDGCNCPTCQAVRRGAVPLNGNRFHLKGRYARAKEKASK